VSFDIVDRVHAQSTEVQCQQVETGTNLLTQLLTPACFFIESFSSGRAKTSNFDRKNLQTLKNSFRHFIEQKVKILIVQKVNFSMVGKVQISNTF
jgi:hypothetical protein